MRDEMMEEEEEEEEGWIEDEDEFVEDEDEFVEDEFVEEEEFIEDSWMELEKARGEKAIKCTKKKPKTSKKNSLEELNIVFEDTDNLDIGDTYGIKITGKNIIVGHHDGTNTSFKKVNVNKIKGKRFLEYVAGQIEDVTGPELKLTLAFEKGYSIEITDYNSIEEQK
jgi:hypothetical protein